MCLCYLLVDFSDSCSLVVVYQCHVFFVGAEALHEEVKCVGLVPEVEGAYVVIAGSSEAETVLDEMMGVGIVPDVATINAVMAACPCVQYADCAEAWLTECSASVWQWMVRATPCWLRRAIRVET